jgi:hypothetical protein
MKLLNLKRVHGILQMHRRYGDVGKPRTGHTRPRPQPARWLRQPPSSQRSRGAWWEEICAPVYLRQHPEF